MQTQYIKKTEYVCFYYSDKEMTKLHRTDGPAIEWSDGQKQWYLNGQLHRTDGPAIEWSYGTKEWWLNGESMSEHEYLKRTKQSRTIEINGRSFTIEELNKLINGAKR